MMVIEVADAGEGMTREIIDNRLTRLFSSAKEGDYTKIGRFGIGFVSVFALDPEIVCVDTGRAGEHWRVVFRRDRSFERIRLTEPGGGDDGAAVPGGQRRRGGGGAGEGPGDARVLV
jgi:hypothetical protein